MGVDTVLGSIATTKECWIFEHLKQKGNFKFNS